MVFTIPTTKDEMYETLNELFRYYRIRHDAYEEMQLQEYKQEQEAKKYYLALERLAGKEAVDSLILSQYALKNELINTEKIKK